MAVVAKKNPPSVDLAVIMGGPPKAKKPPREMDDMPEEAAGEEAMESSDGAFDAAYEEFNDPGLDPEERKAAFKRAVMACMEGDY